MASFILWYPNVKSTHVKLYHRKLEVAVSNDNGDLYDVYYSLLGDNRDCDGYQAYPSI